MTAVVMSAQIRVDDRLKMGKRIGAARGSDDPYTDFDPLIVTPWKTRKRPKEAANVVMPNPEPETRATSSAMAWCDIRAPSRRACP